MMTVVTTCLFALAAAGPKAPPAPLAAETVHAMLQKAGFEAKLIRGCGTGVLTEITAAGKKRSVYFFIDAGTVEAVAFLTDGFGKAPRAVVTRAERRNPWIRPYFFDVSGGMVTLNGKLPTRGISPAKLKQLLDGMAPVIEKGRDIWDKGNWPKE